MLTPGGHLDGDIIEVAVSAIEHYSYCPRQCALIHVEQTFDENQYTIRGQIDHRRVDDAGGRSTRGAYVIRGMPLWSDRLGLRGRADVVEMRADGPYPVEYKSGTRHGPHAELQLCAQALCLEEMLGVSIPEGALYFRRERRRHRVQLDTDLRVRTEEVIEAVRHQLREQEVPEAVNDARCRNCSLLNACLPGVVGDAGRVRRERATLAQPLPLVDETARRRPRNGRGDDA